jgi:hypothetical protein
VECFNAVIRGFRFLGRMDEARRCVWIIGVWGGWVGGCADRIGRVYIYIYINIYILCICVYI